jgi:hypothetical protein
VLVSVVALPLLVSCERETPCSASFHQPHAATPSRGIAGAWLLIICDAFSAASCATRGRPRARRGVGAVEVVGALPLAVRLVDRSLPLAQENRAIYLNAACVYAGGLGDADRALEMVRAAVEGGWPDPEQIRTDDDLTLLYGNPEFQALFDRPAPDGEPSKESDRATG